MENLFQRAGCGIYTSALDEFTQRWGIVDRADQARFLAQLSVESQGFTKVRESMSYRAETLLRVCNGRNGVDTLDKATAIVSSGPTAVANALYGGAWGAAHLGNLYPGDGALYVGRGLIQLTGRDNYVAATKHSKSGGNFVSEPELLTVAKYAADVACWFWMSRELKGVTDVVTITKKINGGSEGLARRQALTDELLQFV